MYFRFIATSSALLVAADASASGDLSMHVTRDEAVEKGNDQEKFLRALNNG